jgi:hypothetical protein
MKKLFKYLLTTRTDLKILLSIAICTYFIIELLLKRYNELFDGGYEIGQFFSNLSISYISAFIFYFIVVHIKSQKDKENVNEWVGHKVYSIITSAHLFIQPLQQLENKKARYEELKESDLSKLLRSVVRTAPQAPYIINDNRASWLEWYEYLKKSTEKSIKEIFVRYLHLDTELIKLLSRIENSLFFYQWDLLYSLEHDVTFGIYEFQIKTYMKLIKELEEYADNNFKEFKYRTSEFIGNK